MGRRAGLGQGDGDPTRPSTQLKAARLLRVVRVSGESGPGMRC